MTFIYRTVSRIGSFSFFLSLCITMFCDIRLEMIIASFLAPIHGFLGVMLLICVFAVTRIGLWSLITGIFERNKKERIKKIKRFFMALPAVLLILVWCITSIYERKKLLLYIEEYIDVVYVCSLCIFQYLWRFLYCLYLIGPDCNKHKKLIDVRMEELVYMFMIAAKRLLLGIWIGLIFGAISLLLYNIISKDAWHMIFEYVFLFPIYCCSFFPIEIERKAS